MWGRAYCRRLLLGAASGAVRGDAAGDAAGGSGSGVPGDQRVVPRHGGAGIIQQPGGRGPHLLGADHGRRDRPYLASTPKGECAAFVVRHRHALLSSVAAEIGVPDGDMDTALRDAVQALLCVDGPGEVSMRGRAAVRVLDRELRAPRDMGLLAMAPLRALARALAAGEE